MNTQSRTVEVSGCRAQITDVGSGKPVLMLHGGGPGATGLSNFARNVSDLSRDHRVIVVDLPGFGGTDPWPGEGGLFRCMGLFVEALLDHLELDCASIIGNSMGGGIGIDMAIRVPERIDRLVLMGPAGGLTVSTPMPTEGLLRMVTFYGGDGPSEAKLRTILESLVHDPAQLSEVTFAERYADATKPDRAKNYAPLKYHIEELWREKLTDIQAPTLLLWGREDRVIPLDAAYTYLRLMPRAELHVFPNCGHWVQWERAVEFNALVRHFLNLGEG